MPGPNFQVGPLPALSPQLLAQLAAAGFKPPPGFGMPGLPSIAQAPGFNLVTGLEALNKGVEGLANWKPKPTIMNLNAGGGGAGSPDFLTGLLNNLSSLFGGGAGSAAGGSLGGLMGGATAFYP